MWAEYEFYRCAQPDQLAMSAQRHFEFQSVDNSSSTRKRTESNYKLASK